MSNNDQSPVSLADLTTIGSERKIDNIARDIDDIKLLLQELNLPGQPPVSASQAQQPLPQATSNSRDKPLSVNITTAAPATIAQWDHSSHVIDFVRALVEDRSGMNHDGQGPESESSQVISSLRNLLDALENPSIARNSHPDASAAANQQVGTSMPPLESAVGILRWARSMLPVTQLLGFLLMIQCIKTPTDFLGSVKFFPLTSLKRSVAKYTLQSTTTPKLSSSSPIASYRTSLQSML